MNDNLIDLAYKNFAMKIIEQAVHDYQRALETLSHDDLTDKEQKKAKKEVAEDEHFFKSNYFKILGGNLDGNVLFKDITVATVNFITNSKTKFDEGYISEKDGKNYIENSEAFLCPICGGKVFIDYKKLKDITQQIEEKGVKKYVKIGYKIGFKSHCDWCFFSTTRVEKTFYFDSKEGENENGQKNI